MNEDVIEDTFERWSVPPSESDSWTWGYGDADNDEILGFETSVCGVLKFMDTYGPFIGIIGFSSGATLATVVASILEGNKNTCNIQYKVSTVERTASLC